MIFPTQDLLSGWEDLVHIKCSTKQKTKRKDRARERTWGGVRGTDMVLEVERQGLTHSEEFKDRAPR